jgi:hypothetical protein
LNRRTRAARAAVTQRVERWRTYRIHDDSGRPTSELTRPAALRDTSGPSACMTRTRPRIFQFNAPCPSAYRSEPTMTPPARGPHEAVVGGPRSAGHETVPTLSELDRAAHPEARRGGHVRAGGDRCPPGSGAPGQVGRRARRRRTNRARAGRRGGSSTRGLKVGVRSPPCHFHRRPQALSRSPAARLIVPFRPSIRRRARTIRGSFGLPPGAEWRPVRTPARTSSGPRPRGPGSGTGPPARPARRG